MMTSPCQPFPAIMHEASPILPTLTGHIPVMAMEMLDALAPRAGGVYVDATFGRGGYSRALLAHAGTRVIGFDRDPQAIAAGQALCAATAGRLTLIESCFSAMAAHLHALGHATVDGIVFDLGVSSPQLDDASRGFTFREDAPLDMRMGQDGATAADLVNSLSEQELAKVIFEYGEERMARRVARAIVSARTETPITRTGALAKLVRSVVPGSRDGLDPATRTFQALRILVNDEIGELRQGLHTAEQLLAPGGRLVVVSFHSLEDREVKEFLRRRAGLAPQPSRHTPFVPPATDHNGNTGRGITFQLLFRRPVSPSETEVAANPRARSAHLRAAERTAVPAAAAQATSTYTDGEGA